MPLSMATPTKWKPCQGPWGQHRSVTHPRMHAKSWTRHNLTFKTTRVNRWFQGRVAQRTRSQTSRLLTKMLLHWRVHSMLAFLLWVSTSWKKKKSGSKSQSSSWETQSGTGTKNLTSKSSTRVICSKIRWTRSSPTLSFMSNSSNGKAPKHRCTIPIISLSPNPSPKSQASPRNHLSTKWSTNQATRDHPSPARSSLTKQCSVESIKPTLWRATPRRPRLWS